MKDDTTLQCVEVAPTPPTAPTTTPAAPTAAEVEQSAATVPDLGSTMGEAVAGVGPIGALDGGAAYADYVDDDDDVC